MTRLQGRYYSARKGERVQTANEFRQTHATIARALFSGDRERSMKALGSHLEMLAHGA